MMKQKKIIYFSILILAIVIIIATFNIQNIQEIFYILNKSNLTEITIPIEEWNITQNYDELTILDDVDFLIGRYQFNYTGASNEFSEENSYNFSSGTSHLSIMSPYEEGPYGNSSGAYLDGSYNQDGFIYKAYLVIETHNISKWQDYPITLIYGGMDGTPINGIKTLVEQVHYRIGYIDITDYIKKNGYGWYYCCNIPHSTISDASDDWKIVVIEENPKLDIRALKLQLGCLVASYNREVSSTITLNKVPSKKVGNVTGQLLYSFADIDGINVGKIQVDTGNGYKNVISKNGYRTSNSPLPGIKLRNTLPLQIQTNYPNPRYYPGSNSSLTKSPNSNSVILTGQDAELLDIDGTTDYHNITINNNINSVSIKFNPKDYYLYANTFGIAYDIEAPEYNSQQTSIVHNESYVTVNGIIENTSTATSEVGMHNGKITVTIDKDLTILSTTAYFTDSKGNRTELNESMYKINHENNTITYIYGKDTDGRSLLGDTLTYTIETNSENLLYQDKAKYTITNEVTSNGKLIYAGNNEDYEMDNVIWTTSSATLYKPLTLTIKPNGGIYENSTTDSTYKTYTEQTHEIHTPIKNGYTFKGWSIEGTNSSLNQNTLSIGITDTTLTANWELDPLILKSTVNLNLSDNKGGIELNWSDYNIQNKYFVIYRKLPISSTYETIVPIEKHLSSNNYIDNLANDKTAPTEPQINISTDNQSIKITPSSQDSGSTYSYYIESYDSTTNILLNKSNEIYE